MFKKCTQFIRSNKRDCLTGLILFCVFAPLYTFLSKTLQRTPIHPFIYFDTLFDLDIPRAISEMTDFHADHYSARKHPIYPLMINPIGVLLGKLPFLKGSFTNTAIALNSTIAGFNVVLSFILFRLIAARFINALIMSLIFAFSMAYLTLAIIPETYTPATFSLLLTYTLFWTDLYRRKVPMKWWVLSGILSLGVLTTNVIQTILCYSVAQFVRQDRKFKKYAPRIILFPILTIGITIILSLIQKKIYPSAGMFFIPGEVLAEKGFLGLWVIKQPFLTLSELFKHFFMVNIISGIPIFEETGSLVPITTFLRAWSFSFVGWIALGLWTILIFFKSNSEHFKKLKWFYTGLILCIGFNFVFHCFYTADRNNLEYFIYTCNFTLLILLLFLTRHLIFPRKMTTILLAVFCLTLGVNNLSRVKLIIDTYQTYESDPRVEQMQKEYKSSLKNYEEELNAFKQEFDIQNKQLPDAEFMMFGLGNRPKLLYTGGFVWNLNDLEKPVKEAEYYLNEQFFYDTQTVSIVADEGITLRLLENADGLFIYSNLELAETFTNQPINIPDFSQYKYSKLMGVLYREILVNIQDGVPHANILSEAPLTDLDKQNIVSVLQKTGNLDLIKDWLKENPQITPLDQPAGNLNDVRLGKGLSPLTYRWTSGKYRMSKFRLISEEFREENLVAPHAGEAAYILNYLLNQ